MGTDSMRESVLEHLIRSLELTLDRPSVQAFPDVQSELQRHQAALRKLKARAL
jgi:hypothetical protein